MPQFLQNLQRYANDPLEFVNGVVRVGRKIGNEIEYGRKQINNFIEDVVPEPIVNTLDSASLTLADTAQFVYENHPVGLAEQGAIILGGNTAETVGLPRGVGEFVGGALAPGFAAPAPSAITRATRAATKNSVKTAVKETAEGLKTIGDDLMPPPPAALATAGAAPSVQLNVSGGKANLTPKVMELTIKDPEFLEPLDNLGVREGIANTPANIKAREMLDKSLDRLDKRRAKLDSDVASGRIKKGSSRYNQKNKKIREERYGEMSSFFNQLDQDPPAFKKQGEKHVDPTNIDVVAEQHHLAAKAQTEPFIEIMLEVGDPDDLVALHEYSRMLGVIMGNSKRNMLDAPGPIHRVAMAKTAKEKAGNIHSVFNAARMEPNNAYVRNLLKDAKSADDVMRVFKKYANEYLIPQQNIAKKIVKNYLDDYSIKLTTSERNKFNKLVSELN